VKCAHRWGWAVSKHLVGYSVDYAYEVLGIRDVQVVLADDADAEVAKWQELRSAAVKGMKRHQERSRELTKRLNIRGNEVASLKAQLAAALNAQAGVVEALDELEKLQPTPQQMVEAGWCGEYVMALCEASDKARAALAAVKGVES
jgi:hypothetical protein